MVTCYKTCWETGKKYAEGGAIPSLVAGANIAGGFEAVWDVD
jgi:glutamate dehydrogenase (NADP+)